jgi:hypothetical protein
MGEGSSWWFVSRQGRFSWFRRQVFERALADDPDGCLVPSGTAEEVAAYLEELVPGPLVMWCSPCDCPSLPDQYARASVDSECFASSVAAEYVQDQLIDSYGRVFGRRQLLVMHVMDEPGSFGRRQIVTLTE